MTLLLILLRIRSIQSASALLRASERGGLLGPSLRLALGLCTHLRFAFGLRAHLRIELGL